MEPGMSHFVPNTKDVTMYKRFIPFLTMTALTMICSNAALAQQTGKTESKAKPASKETTIKGARPAASPGWVVLEEDWWLPFRYDFSSALDTANVQFRRGEEKSAANEIGRAVGWLQFAEAHATDDTRPQLESAISEMKTLATDLENGQIMDATRLERVFSRASMALAKHHYFKASTALANNELKFAGQDLLAAAEHIQHAANSANVEYSQDLNKMRDELVKSSKIRDDLAATSMETLQRHLGKIKNELETLGKQLEKSFDK
jgi:hypothetical protein